ncbi:MAG: hypothetical protein RL291_1495 [Pseudomonadota bacterium]
MTDRPAATPAVVITGASDGIGRALAQQFADPAKTFVLLGRDQPRLDSLAAELQQQPGLRALTLSLDLTDSDAPAKLDALLERENLWIETLINSAGIGQSGPFAGSNPADIDNLVALNVAALTRLTRRALGDMRARKRGSIINLSSLGAYAPGPYQAAYYASKAYVLSLSEALSHELKTEHIHVLAVVPGPVRTNFHARMGTLGAWYLKLMPIPTPETVARHTHLAHRLKLRMVAPGLSAALLIPAMKVLPHRLLLPLVGFLLRPR